MEILTNSDDLLQIILQINGLGQGVNTDELFSTSCASIKGSSPCRLDLTIKQWNPTITTISVPETHRSLADAVTTCVKLVARHWIDRVHSATTCRRKRRYWRCQKKTRQFYVLRGGDGGCTTTVVVEAGEFGGKTTVEVTVGCVGMMIVVWGRFRSKGKAPTRAMVPRVPKLPKIFSSSLDCISGALLRGPADCGISLWSRSSGCGRPGLKHSVETRIMEELWNVTLN